MSGSWSRGPQYHASASPMGAPPLICFNCGQNHLLINCPVPKDQATANYLSPFQSQAPPVYHQYPGPVQSPYQQYHQNQQYGPPGQSHYGYSQPPPQQSYNAPPMAAPFTNPLDLAAPSQYPNGSSQQQYGVPPQMNGPQQYGSQQYGPPQATPYNVPSPAYPLSHQNGGYNGNFGPPVAQHQGHPQQNWNNMRPSPPGGGPSPYELQKRTYADMSAPAAPGYESQSSLSFQSANRTHHNQHPPQRAGSVDINHRSTPSSNNSVPATTSFQSKASSASSTPFSQRGPAAGSDVKALNNHQEHPLNENGEVSELSEDQQFEWDMTWIFKEGPQEETVALAQPLSVNFAMGPIPLMDPASTSTVSRYARKDNVKSFSKSIRDAPQWSFIQEDPAFAELDVNSPLIPIEDIPSWVARRHGMVDCIEIEANASRKRVRSADGEETLASDQGEAMEQITQQAVAEAPETSRPNKRQKNDEREDDSEIRQETPILAADMHASRSGTPCLENDDNAWAPGPDESATSLTLPEDPMEALLASLGVTGAPKPVSPIPDAQCEPFIEHARETLVEQPASTLVQSQAGPQASINSQRNVKPIRNSHVNGQGSRVQLRPPNLGSAPQNASTPNGSHQNGSHRNRPHHSGSPGNPDFSHQQHQPQFATQSSQQYQNVPPPSARYHITQFTNPNHSQYGNGINTHPQGAYPNQIPHSNAMNGRPYSGNPNNGQYASGVNGSSQSATSSYGAPTNQGHFNGSPANPPYNGPLNYQPRPEVQQNSSFFGSHANGHLNQQEYSSGPPQSPNIYGQHSNGQFDALPQQQHGSWPRQNNNFNHGNGPFNGSPNRSHGCGTGPQQNQNSNGQPSYNRGPRRDNGQPKDHGNGDRGHSQSADKPLTHSQNGPNMQNNGPVRQDSSCGNTNESLGSGSALHVRNGHYNAQSQFQEMPPPNGPFQHVDDAVQNINNDENNENHPISYGKQGSPEAEDYTSGEHTQDGSPLSPMSQEILGKLAQPTRKASRIKKRRAPEVDEAYSRRW